MTAPNLSHGDMWPILSVERFSQRHAILKALRQRFTLDYATFRRTSGRIDNNGSSGKVVIVGYSRTIAGMENIKHALRWRELLKSERLAFHQIQQYASAQQMRCLRIANQGTQRRHYA
ncbi:hypothetical protein [Bifidobacterium pseudocatenulatum]|uniref:hypothetical protein n=1 Tax=Bifidobacterium pseudocatenulatum TaxID=28026 RepID=UPI0011C22E96|nr:hypothetical protein [Bifidobacterium pseudocatenulatum]